MDVNKKREASQRKVNEAGYFKIFYQFTAALLSLSHALSTSRIKCFIWRLRNAKHASQLYLNRAIKVELSHAG